jgi:hypothetical protein
MYFIYTDRERNTFTGILVRRSGSWFRIKGFSSLVSLCWHWNTLRKIELQSSEHCCWNRGVLPDLNFNKTAKEFEEIELRLYHLLILHNYAIAIAKLKKYRINLQIVVKFRQTWFIQEVKHYSLRYIWSKKDLPDQWKESIVVPVYKNGDKTDCNNYRGMSLLSNIIFCPISVSQG